MFTHNIAPVGISSVSRPSPIPSALAHIENLAIRLAPMDIDVKSALVLQSHLPLAVS